MENVFWRCHVCGHDVFVPADSIHGVPCHCENCTTVFLSPLQFSAPRVKFKKLNSEAKIPTRGSEQAVGLDVYSIEWAQIKPGSVQIVKTGLAVELPPNTELQVRARSGHAKSGLLVANAPGTVDPDYRGEIGVLIYNSTQNWINIEKGDRFAQFVISKKLPYELVEVKELSETKRGSGAYNSTGKK